MNKKVITAVSMIAFGLAGCSFSADKASDVATPTVTVTATPSLSLPPAPTPPAGDATYQNAIQVAWDTLSKNEQDQACFLYRVSPDEAWDSFNAGAEGVFPRSEFEIFFDNACGISLG